MGLFSKKPKTSAAESVTGAAGIEELRASLANVQRRLDASETDKAELGRDIAVLRSVTIELSGERTKVGELSSRLDELHQLMSSPAPEAGVPQPPDPDVAARIDALAERIALLDHGTDEGAGARPEATQLGPTVVEWLETLHQRVLDIDALGNQLTDVTTQMTDQADVTARLADRVTSSEAAVRAATEQVASLDQRLSQIGTELANQLNELSGDIDHLSSQPAPDDVAEQRVADLRAGQIKLAAEQARYEIAFRDDLAALAEQLRRAAGR